MPAPLAVKVAGKPLQIAALVGETLMAGAATTCTVTDAAGPEHPLLTADTLYTPAFAADTLVMVTDGRLLLNPFGPVHV